MFRAAQKSGTTSTSTTTSTPALASTSATPRLNNDATKSTVMPFDRPKQARSAASNMNATPPLKPKAPLTPRVAASNQSTTSSVRRANKDNNQDITTPVSSFFQANNITPRSGNRKSRIDSPASTPNNTPTPVLLPHNSRRPISPIRSDVAHHQHNVDAEKDSKFFFASDAKPAAQITQKQNRPPLLTKTSTSSFLYANGSTLPSSSTRSGGSVVADSVPSFNSSEERNQPKFFRANTSPDIKQSPQLQTSHSSISNSTHKLAQVPLSGSPAPRSLSPVKSFTSTPNNTNKSVAPLPARPPLTSTAEQRHLRRISGDVPLRIAGHVSNTSIGSEAGGKALSSKRSSVGSDLGITPHLAKRFSNGSTMVANPPSPVYTIPSPSYPSAGLASPNTFFPGITSPSLSSKASYLDESTVTANTNSSTAPSTLATHSEEPEDVNAGNSLAKMNELAAQARRERKVLDLEIRNTSLESINKTLEKQMRKQAAELRRYRRLSRSGRLSVLPTSSNRTTMDRLSRIGEDDEDSNEDDSFGFSDDEFEYPDAVDESDLSDDIDEGALGPDALAAHDARHRERDEKRLQLDLTKHQELLIDSQKMNQSLKKCLSWTEELIADGKKALAYNVKVSDVQLGGRVLALDIDDDANDEEGEGELSDEQFVPIDHEGDSMHERMSEISAVAWRSVDDIKFNRDSGIDIIHHSLEVQ